MWANVHVEDLSDCFLKLVEAAAFGGGTATWNQEGYYFTENGEHVWSDMSRLISKDAHKKGRTPLFKAYQNQIQCTSLSMSGVSVRERHDIFPLFFQPVRFVDPSIVEWPLNENADFELSTRLDPFR